jgi:hypothetical protein
MLHPRTPASSLAHFESNASFEETLFRLEHALARSSWRVVARVDSHGDRGCRAGPARLFVLAPPQPEEAAHDGLTWSLALHNEVLVVSDPDGRVLVGYPTPPEATADTQSAHASTTWAASVARALRQAAAAAAGVPLGVLRPLAKVRPRVVAPDRNAPQAVEAAE